MPIHPTTPHGIEAARIIAQGPIQRSDLVRTLRPFVPMGTAIKAAETARRGLKGSSQNRKDDTYTGAQRAIQYMITSRLRCGTWIVNEDGLLQHRDWQPPP